MQDAGGSELDGREGPITFSASFHHFPGAMAKLEELANRRLGPRNFSYDMETWSEVLGG